MQRPRSEVLLKGNSVLNINRLNSKFFRRRLVSPLGLIGCKESFG